MELLDRGRWQRRVTLDISGRSLARRAIDHGLRDVSILPIPFAVLPKGLLLDVDLIGVDGRPMSVVTSGHDSFASQLILADMAADLLGHQVEPSTLEGMYQLASGHKGSTQREQAHSLLRQQLPDLGQVDHFADSFLMMTEIDIERPHSIIKFRLVESYEIGRRSLGEALCISPQYYYVDAPHVGGAQREHLRVTAPKGTFIESAQLYVDGDESTSHGGPDATFIKKVTPERSICYTAGLSPAEYFLLLTLRPVPRGSFTAAALWAIAGFMVTVAGLVGEWLGSILTEAKAGTAAGPVVAVSLSLFSLGSASVLRSDEHELSGHVASRLRTLLLISSATSFAAALSVALEGWDGTILSLWIVAAVLGLVTMTVIITGWMSSWLSYKAVASASDESLENLIEVV